MSFRPTSPGLPAAATHPQPALVGGKPRTHAAVLLCGGRGTRMQGAVEEKTLASLAGRPALAYSLEAFLTSGAVGRFVVVYRDFQQKRALQSVVVKSLPRTFPPVLWVRGGRERQDSVTRALRRLSGKIGLVFIHDAARPLVRPEQILALLEAASREGAASLAHRVTDTVKQVPAGLARLRAVRLKTLDRRRLWAMETPQVFERALITEAYARAESVGRSVTDDTAAVELLGRQVTLVENPHPNPKLTTPADLAYAEFLLTRTP